MPRVLDATAVSRADADRLKQFAESLEPGSALSVVLHGVATSVARGVDVAVIDTEAELTPREVAELLGMSRPHLLKFMDRGELPFLRVGSHRRVRMSDVLDFDERRERAKAAVADAVGNTAAIQQHVRDEAGQLTAEDTAELNSL